MSADDCFKKTSDEKILNHVFCYYYFFQKILLVNTIVYIIIR